MMNQQGTQVGQLIVRQRTEAAEEPRIEWKAAEKKRPGEHLMRNMAVASALLICAVALRSGALPELTPATDAVLAAAKDDSLLDDQLGRLSFVSALFPEATMVFGMNDDDRLSIPVSGGMVVHAWSEAEPYMSWRTEDSIVRAAGAGEVIGVYHGNGDERLVQVMGDEGMACLYGNLKEISVRTGDAVATGDPIGTLQQGDDLVLEVRRDGMSIDPALFFQGV